MSYHLKHENLTPKHEYKRISEFKEGLVVMKQNGFIYLIPHNETEQWEFAVNLSCGQIERREDIENGFDKHNLGFIKLNGTVELTQVPEVYKEIEKIIADHVGWDKAELIVEIIAKSDLI